MQAIAPLAPNKLKNAFSAAIDDWLKIRHSAREAKLSSKESRKSYPINRYAKSRSLMNRQEK
jgi:hypothetical protein